MVETDEARRFKRVFLFVEIKWTNSVKRVFEKYAIKNACYWKVKIWFQWKTQGIIYCKKSDESRILKLKETDINSNKLTIKRKMFSSFKNVRIKKIGIDEKNQNNKSTMITRWAEFVKKKLKIFQWKQRCW